MLTVYARQFIWLGEEIEQVRACYFLAEDKALDDNEIENVKKSLTKLHKHCEQMNLPVCTVLLAEKVEDIPQNYREFELLMKVVYAEIKNKLYVFVSQDRRKYFTASNFLSVTVRKAFPAAYKELRYSGKCFAVEFYTAAVFHAMRAVEIGIRLLADELNVQFPFPKELADWNNLIEKIEAEVKKKQGEPKSAQKDSDLKFYSDACMQFRYFKDGWRIRVAHTREVYDEGPALTALEHSVSFFETLAKRLKEK